LKNFANKGLSIFFNIYSLLNKIKNNQEGKLNMIKLFEKLKVSF